jgi:hypothetical protein
MVELARWCEEHGLRVFFDNVLWAPRWLSLDIYHNWSSFESLQEWQEYANTECTADNRWHVDAVSAVLRRRHPDTATSLIGIALLNYDHAFPTVTTHVYVSTQTRASEHQSRIRQY